MEEDFSFFPPAPPVSSSTPPKITKSFNEAQKDLLPSKSKSKYLIIFDKFIDYLIENKYNIMKLNDGSNSKEFSQILQQILTPKVLLSYFNDLSKKYKASTLWSTRGALARVFLLHGININGNNYSNVNLFLKQKSRLHKQKSILIAKLLFLIANSFLTKLNKIGVLKNLLQIMNKYAQKKSIFTENSLSSPRAKNEKK